MSEKRLLVLDDDAMIGTTIEVIARTVGFDVQGTVTANAFFDSLENWRPTYIVLDLIMPDMDGMEILVELARRNCTVPIIIISGVGHRVLDAAARSASEHGLTIAGVLAKPFTPQSLREILAEQGPGENDDHFSRPGIAQAITPATGEITARELEQAIASEELTMVYQPKVHCHDSSLAGYEALVRWNSPTRGLVPPSEFIPLSEETGLIRPMTRQIVRMALTWFGAGFKRELDATDDNVVQSRTLLNRLTLSINLSARSLDDDGLINFIVAECLRVGIASNRLVFELTETSAMEDPIASLDLLTRLRMKGFQLSIDDFGTGYSSMLQLARLPFSEIKVDRSFVMAASRSEEARAVIRSIVELGHSLGLQTTAEGVEDEYTFEYLKQIDCDLAQGYLIARPMDGEQALAWGMQHLTPVTA